MKKKVKRINKKKLAAKIKTAYAKNRRPKLTAREQATIRKHWEKTTGLR